MAKIRFLQSPTGKPFQLAYNAGETADLAPELAQSLIDAGIAEKVGASEIETTEDPAPAKAEKAVSKRGKKSTK